MSMLVNKLVTITLEADKQYSYHIRETDLKAEDLIQVLSLQAITQSKIRLAADDLMSLNSETLLSSSLSQKTVLLSILIRKTTSFSSFNVREKKLNILNLIKIIQEFNLLCRQISN